MFRSVGGDGGSQAFDASAFASRLIVGAVFGFLIFITIVIYRMWVAQGVVAEKRAGSWSCSSARPRRASS